MMVRWCLVLAGSVSCATSAPISSTASSDTTAPPPRGGGGGTTTTEEISSEFPWTNDTDTRARTTIPDDPVGIVWAFHGAGGGMSSVLQTEWIALYNELVAHDIGVVLTQSKDRERGRWEEEDLEHVAVIWNALVEDHDLPSDLPMGAVAFSAGARMAELLVEHADAEGWTVAALALHQGASIVEEVPTFYVAAENDELGRDESFYEDLGLLDSCVDPCVFREGTEIDLLRHRFARVQGIDADMSEYAFAEAVERGMVDADGVRRISTDRPTLEQYLDRYARALALGGHHDAAATQLRVVWATHRFSSEFALEEASFFRTHFEPQPSEP